MRKETDDINKRPWQVEKYETLFGSEVSVYFDVEDFEEIIEHYLLTNAIKKALQVVEHACSVHPSSIALLLKKAQILATFNKEDHALELLSRIENLDPTNQDIFLTKGAIYSQKMDYRRAIEEYNKAVSGADEPDYVYCSIAFEYENLGNFDKTIEYLDKALAVNPDNDLAIYEAAYCFDLLSLTEEGISFFQKLIDRHPYSSEAWFNLGVSFINAGLYEKALDALDYSLAIDDHHEHSWFHKGYTLSLINRHVEAIQAYKASMVEDEHDGMKFYYIGECYEKLEDFHEARAYYLKSTQADPELADAWAGLAVCESEFGNTLESVNYLKKSLKHDPDNISYLCLLGNAHFVLGQYDCARKAYEQAIQTDPKDEETWLEYAEALSGVDCLDEACQVIHRAMDALPAQSNLLYFMAALLFLQGKTQEGSFFLEEAHSTDAEGLNKLLARFPRLSQSRSFMETADRLSS